MQPILILGIGNILLQDEGIGVRVAEAMQKVELPPEVEVLDGGTSGANIIDVIADRRKLIVIDAVDGDAEPGMLFRLDADDLMPEEGDVVSLHQIGLLESLIMARILGCLPEEIVIFGVQPKTVRPGLELTPEIAGAMPRVIALVMKEVSQTLDRQVRAVEVEPRPVCHAPEPSEPE